MRVKKGFTLIEIVVSLAIIGIMMIPLANSLIMSVKANKMGEIVQESKNISQEIVEGVRSLGDVKETTLKVGSNNEAVQIKVDVGEDGKYTVDGIVDDIMLKGTIKKTDKGGTIEYESDKYLEKKVGLVFYIYSKTNSDRDIENNIIYSYEPKQSGTEEGDIGGVEIREHIRRVENKMKNPTINISKVDFLEDENKIKFNFIERNTCELADSDKHTKCNIEINDIKEEQSAIQTAGRERD